MQFIDVLRMQSLDTKIMVHELWHNGKGELMSKRSQIMCVKNLTWERLRHFEYKNVCQFKACERNGEPFLYVQIDDKEKSYYNR